MKLILLIHVLALFVLFGSCGSEKDAIKLIPGVYVTSYSSSYSTTRDTLVISMERGGTQFKITRRSFHEYIPERKRAPDYTIDHWTAGWAGREGVLLVHQNGRRISFDKGAKELKMGMTRYKKL